MSRFIPYLHESQARQYVPSYDGNGYVTVDGVRFAVVDDLPTAQERMIEQRLRQSFNWYTRQLHSLRRGK